jgi:hypothetical protein
MTKFGVKGGMRGIQLSKPSTLLCIFQFHLPLFPWVTLKDQVSCFVRIFSNTGFIYTAPKGVV